jgi:hypothetical protein
VPVLETARIDEHPNCAKSRLLSAPEDDAPPRLKGSDQLVASHDAQLRPVLLRLQDRREPDGAEARPAPTSL